MSKKSAQTTPPGLTVQASQIPIASTHADQNDEKYKTSFLDLPGELRNRIYSLILPDVELSEIYPGRSLREDGEKAFTNIMAANRQIHSETPSLVYRSAEAEVTFNNSGEITFLGQKITHDLVPMANFAAVDRIKTLKVCVNANEGGAEAAKVQDAMFVFFDSLRPSQHKLHQLTVNIAVAGGVYGSLSSSSDRTSRADIMREFQDIVPGELSRPHITAFLTDPLRNVRRLVIDGRKQAKFDISFTGHTGRPWRMLPSHLRSSAKGDTPASDFQVFKRYDDVRHQLLKAVLPIRMHSIGAYNDFDRYRIRGDVEAFRNQHFRFATNIKKQVDIPLRINLPTGKAAAEVYEHSIREAGHLLHELGKAVPSPGTDTSGYGYNWMDRELKQWRTVGRKEENKAKEKRKREREANTESKKKAKQA